MSKIEVMLKEIKNAFDKNNEIKSKLESEITIAEKNLISILYDNFEYFMEILLEKESDNLKKEGKTSSYPKMEFKFKEVLNTNHQNINTSDKIISKLKVLYKLYLEYSKLTNETAHSFPRTFIYEEELEVKFSITSPAIFELNLFPKFFFKFINNKYKTIKIICEDCSLFNKKNIFYLELV